MAACRTQALLGLVLLILFHTIFANHVRRIEVMTSDCEDCGMSILGQLSVKVWLFSLQLIFCIFYYFSLKYLQLCGNGPGQCCVAENLDNFFSDDFNRGELSSFEGSTLGECNGFDLGQKEDWTSCMTLYHSGMQYIHKQAQQMLLHTLSFYFAFDYAQWYKMYKNRCIIKSKS